jgi:hypothetical protein
MSITDFCVYCGATEDLTDDHVPPECIFPKPRPAGLITVRACKSCNASASKDDEYFRMMLCMSEDVGESSEARKNLPVIVRSLERPAAAGMKAALFRNTSRVAVMTQGGLYLGHRLAYNVTLERICRVVGRTVRGLYFREMGRRLPKGYDVQVHCDDTLRATPQDALAELHATILLPLSSVEPKVVVPGVFEYRFKAAQDNEAISAWALTFYERKPFLALVGPAEQSGEGTVA